MKEYFHAFNQIHLNFLQDVPEEITFNQIHLHFLQDVPRFQAFCRYLQA